MDSSLEEELEKMSPGTKNSIPEIFSNEIRQAGTDVKPKKSVFFRKTAVLQ